MLGRYFLQTRGIFPLVFLTFLPPLPGHLPSCPLASPGKIRPWERSLGLADIVAQGFGHGWKTARRERRISPKRGALPPTGVRVPPPRLDFVHGPRGRASPPRRENHSPWGGSRDRRVGEKNPRSRLQGKELQKKESEAPLCPRRGWVPRSERWFSAPLELELGRGGYAERWIKPARPI